jgi:ubiquinone/menaquinone biosynthesis C-methylase UbiE
MDQSVEQSILDYYEQRAEEYKELYLLGKGPASIKHPGAYKAEVALPAGLVERVAFSRLIDIACGTAFWMPWYAGGCSAIILVDQSEKMLAASRRRASVAPSRDGHWPVLPRLDAILIFAQSDPFGVVRRYVGQEKGGLF